MAGKIGMKKYVEVEIRHPAVFDFTP